MPHYLISHFANCVSISISWITWLIFTYKLLAKDGCTIILIDMETSNATSFSNSSINTPAANVITLVSHYTFMHMSTVNYILNVGIFCKLPYNRKKFSANNKDHVTVKLFHHEQFALYGMISS